MRIWEVQNWGTGWRPDAPYRKYSKTDDSVYDDGFKSGLEWPVKWNHRPGGPWVPRVSDYELKNSHPDWIEHVETLNRHNKIWLKGWEDGLRKQAETNPEIEELGSKLGVI